MWDYPTAKAIHSAEALDSDGDGFVVHATKYEGSTRPDRRFLGRLLLARHMSGVAHANLLGSVREAQVV